MNTEIASSPLYPSVHLLLRASKLAAPENVWAKTAQLVSASPSGTVKSFSLRYSDCSSTAEWRRAVTRPGKKVKIILEKKTREPSLRLAQAATVFFVSCWSHRSGHRGARRAEETSSVFGSSRFLKGPHCCCRGAKWKEDASQTSVWPEMIMLKTARGRQFWGKCQHGELDSTRSRSNIFLMSCISQKIQKWHNNI